MSDQIFLSKYSPLKNILFADDFDNGINGWCELIGNHDGDLNKVRKVMEDLRPPQLSNANFFDIGSHGSLSGTYSMKLATRAKAGHMAQTIKRATSRSNGRVRVECYFTYKSEQIFGAATNWDGNVDPSETNFGDFTISNDICEGDDGVRYHCALRYLNTDETGKLVQHWMYKTSVQPSTKMVMSGMVQPNYDYHVINKNDWKPVPNGHQPLCYNEIPTKINWHYLRWDFDTRLRRNVELQVNDKIMPLHDIPVPVYEHRYKALSRLMNFCLDVRTHRPVRNFLFIDSVVASFEQQ